MCSVAIVKVEGAFSWVFCSWMAIGTIDVAEVGLPGDGDVFIYRFETRRAEPR